MCALKETLIFHSSRAEIAKNQTHNLTLHVADTKCNLNSQFVSVFTVQLSILIGKEWVPESWDVYMWEDIDEVGDDDPLILMKSL